MGINDNLDNLVRSGGLKLEPYDTKECAGLICSAADRLRDAHNSTLSYASRFDLGYNAAHALALAAMRLRGYRSDRRYLVFQCLPHTLALDKVQVRLFALCAATLPNTKATWISMSLCLKNCSRVLRLCICRYRRR